MNNTPSQNLVVQRSREKFKRAIIPEEMNRFINNLLSEKRAVVSSGNIATTNLQSTNVTSSASFTAGMIAPPSPPSTSVPVSLPQFLLYVCYNGKPAKANVYGTVAVIPEEE